MPNVGLTPIVFIALLLQALLTFEFEGDVSDSLPPMLTNVSHENFIFQTTIR